MAQQHSLAFKQQIVKKLLLNNGKGLLALSREMGIPASTIASWRKKMQITGTVSGQERLANDWSLQEKIQAVFESGQLDKEDLGSWLRSKGLHSNHLELWKQEIIDMSQDKKYELELKQAKKKIKELEADLRKKEKALAEASALLVLKKKAHLIWGEEEDD